MHSPAPWRLRQKQEANPKAVYLADANGQAVFETDWIPNQQEIDDWNHIISCVNTFSKVGWLDGDVPAQARAWVTVYEALCDAGLKSFVPDPIMGSGVERAVQFIKHLKEKADEKMPTV